MLDRMLFMSHVNSVVKALDQAVSARDFKKVISIFGNEFSRSVVSAYVTIHLHPETSPKGPVDAVEFVGGIFDSIRDFTIKSAQEAIEKMNTPEGQELDRLISAIAKALQETSDHTEAASKEMPTGDNIIMPPDISKMNN